MAAASAAFCTRCTSTYQRETSTEIAHSGIISAAAKQATRMAT